MIFKSPEWFILLPMLAGLGWFLRDLKLWLPLRCFCLLLVVVILTEPQLRRLAEGMDLWVLIDRSASAAEVVSRDAQEWEQLLEKSRPSSNDNLRIIDFAAEVSSFDNKEPGAQELNSAYTRTGLALRHVLSQVSPSRHSRVLLFSDGYSTEPLADAGRQLQKMEVPLDFRLLREEEDEDFRVLDLEIAPRRQVGEPFLIRVAVTGSADAAIPLIISRNGRTLIETTVTLEQGRGEIEFSDRITVPGAYQYEALITPATDAHSGNNHFENWIDIKGGPRVLLATKYTDDPVARILQAQGFEVDTVTDYSLLTVGRLSGSKAVILNNVAAYEVPGAFLDAMDFFVRSQGGGLLMAGGKQSFGSGGYFESAVDELLPVSMELKTEHRKLAVAMAVVMDRSGSMGAVVSGGISKMDLANEGTARAVELLGAQDMVTVFAVDSTPHEIVPPLNVGKFRAEITGRVRRIQSQGGGIYVYSGLQAGWDAIKNTELGQRHIILFSDAADSEEPGRYRALLKEVTANGGSVSVIGLGTESDPDAAFLKDVALRGNGRIFFTRDANRLPNIFAQETVTVARSTFVMDPIGTNPTGGWFEISSDPFEWLESVDGYNLSYLRENATAALVTTDEYTAPLVAFAQRGIGRSAAVSFPLGGEFSASARQWEKAGDFVQTITRWLMGEELPPGIGFRSSLEGTRLTLDLLHTDEWVEKLVKTPPRCVLVEGTSSDRFRELTWERIAPGQYTAIADLEPGKLLRGAIQVGGAALSFGPLTVGASPEWSFDAARVAELKEISRLSGGRELLDLAHAWLKPARQEFSSIRNWLLVALLLLVLVEVLATRLGWKLPLAATLSLSNVMTRRAERTARPRTKPAAAKITAEPKPKEEAAPEEPKPKTKKTEPRPETAEESRARFARAKKRRR